MSFHEYISQHKDIITKFVINKVILSVSFIDGFETGIRIFAGCLSLVLTCLLIYKIHQDIKINRKKLKE